MVKPAKGKTEPKANSASLKDQTNETIPGQNKTTRTTLLTLALTLITGVVIRYFYSANVLPKPNSIIDETLKSMLSIESRVNINKHLNVAVGFGSCLDIYVSGRDLIFDHHEAPKKQIHHETIRTQKELNEVLAYFFGAGAAAERYIDNQTFFQELVDKARSVAASRHGIGGNAFVMARRFALEGLERVLLGTQVSKSTAEDFSNQLVVSGPMVDRDDVHICIEYPAGERWGKYVSPRANRLIIHSDHFNPSLKSVDNFIERLDSTKNLDLLVIGGLQMMDNIPVDMKVRNEKLERFGQVLARLPSTKPKVHLELASFTEEALLKSIKDNIIPHVDSMGMNEQELPTLLNYLSNGKIDIRSEAYVSVASTLDKMRQLFRILHKQSGRKTISRIHTHTIAFQAILTKLRSGWNNTLTSSVKAALTAHRHTCGSHEIDMAKAKLIMDESYTTSKQISRRRIPFNPKHPAICWQEDIHIEDSESATKQGPKVETIEICVAPVLVCTKVKQTAAAGDNISAVGLIYQF